MLKTIQDRGSDGKTWVRVTMAVVLGLICLAMVITLVPGLMNGSLTSGSTDAVATVGSDDISLVDAEQQLSQQTQSQNMPAMLRGIYAKQIVDQMIYAKALQVEADRLGVTVTPDEERERIKQILPMAFSGDTWLKDQYETAVQNNLRMTVPQFETALRDAMIEEKVKQMVTSGITVSEAEIQQEFKARNEKVQVQYALVKPADIAATIHPSDADLAAYFAKNATKYQVPEKRVARYGILDTAKLRTSEQATDADVNAYYTSHQDEFKVENRADVAHILFKTVGKTDAEIAEIKQKAQDVVKQAKSGAKFEDLVKKNTEDDATKDKGGDMGWIVDGQTAPQVQQAAFSLPKGSISDPIQTTYGIEIIKVIDRETAHTKTLAEVKDSITPMVIAAEAGATANDAYNQISASVRQSDHQSLDDMAKKFNLQIVETPAVSYTEPVGDLGNTADVHRLLFELRVGEVGQPLQLDQGVVVMTVKNIQSAHQGTLAEVHDQVLSDYQKDQSAGIAASRAIDLAKAAQSGTALDKVAKDAGVDVKTSDYFARSGSIPDVGTGKQVTGAFTMNVGQVSAPVNLSGNWLVFKVVAKNEPNPDDLTAQHNDIQQQLLQTKQDAAYEAFKTSLQDQLKKEGKLVIHDDVMQRFLKSAS
jgi:peptidyl-prolyl cis-trans isomerase D